MYYTHTPHTHTYTAYPQSHHAPPTYSLKAFNSSMVAVLKKPLQDLAFRILSIWLYASPWGSGLMAPPAISDLIHSPTSHLDICSLFQKVQALGVC